MGEGTMTETGAFFTPRAVADFDIKVIVTDGIGNTDELLKTVSIVDGKSTAFNNFSAVNYTTAKPGTRIEMVGAASGSSGYRYAFYYKRNTASVWTILGTEFGTETTAGFKPRTEGKFKIKIDIIDANGELVSKTYKVNITETTENAPVNSSTVSATEVTAGTKLTITGAVSGGAGGYTYTYEQKKSTSSKWNTIGTANTTSTSQTFTPKTAGTVEIRVTVTDSAGISTAKVISVTVK